MPEIVTCPNCNRKLRVPDDLIGKKVKCPDCKEAFTAQTETISKTEEPADEAPERPSSRRGEGVSRRRDDAESESAPPPRFDSSENEYRDEDHPVRNDYDDDIEDPAREGLRGGWRSVRLGLTMQLSSIYTWLGGLFLYILSAVVAGVLFVLSGAGFINALVAPTSSSANNSGAAAGTSFIIAIVIVVCAYVVYGLCSLAAFVLQTIAHIVYLYIPNKPGTGRRGLAISQASLFAAFVLFPLAGCMLYCGGMAGGTGTRNAGVMAGGVMGYYCAIFLALLCYIAWFFVHMLFLRTIARAMGDEGLGRTLLIYMICYPSFIVLSFLSVLAVGCIGGFAAASFATSSATSGGSGGGTALGGWLIAIIVLELLIILTNIAMMIWYVVILHKVRGSVTTRLAT